MDDSSGISIRDLEALRFSLDVPSKGVCLPLSSHLRAVSLGLTLNELLVSEAIAPVVENAVDGAVRNLRLSREDVDVFVYASPEIQASCLPSSSEGCVLRLSSALVSLLGENELRFVIGHELAHHVFKHSSVNFKNEDLSLEEVVSVKYQEVSADRLGLLACQSLKDSVGALIKTASGLGSPYIRLDVSEYLSSLSRFDDGSSTENDASVTSHPPLMIRCRALLWLFGALGSSLNIVNLVPSELDEVNKRIEQDFSRFVDIQASSHRRGLVESYRLWLAVSKIASAGTFTKAAQKKFQESFGLDRLDQIKKFLSGSSRTDAVEFCQIRLAEAVQALKKDFPVSSAPWIEKVKQDVEKLRFSD